MQSAHRCAARPGHVALRHGAMTTTLDWELLTTPLCESAARFMGPGQAHCLSLATTCWTRFELELRTHSTIRRPSRARKHSSSPSCVASKHDPRLQDRVRIRRTRPSRGRRAAARRGHARLSHPPPVPGVEGVGVRRARRARFAMAGTSPVGSSLLLGDGAVLDGLSLAGMHLTVTMSLSLAGAVLGCTGVLARPGSGIRIGDRCGIGDHCYFSGQGGIEVGSDVLFGPGVRIFSENHRFEASELLIRLQGEVRAPVAIEDDCWIGCTGPLSWAECLADGPRVGRGGWPPSSRGRLAGQCGRRRASEDRIALKVRSPRSQRAEPVNLSETPASEDQACDNSFGNGLTQTRP